MDQPIKKIIEIKDRHIEIRSSDNFINVTPLSSRAKQFAAWIKLKSTQKFIKFVKEKLKNKETNEIPIVMELIKDDALRFSQSWLHPLLALNFCSWLGSEYETSMISVLNDLYINIPKEALPDGILYIDINEENNQELVEENDKSDDEHVQETQSEEEIIEEHKTNDQLINFKDNTFTFNQIKVRYIKDDNGNYWFSGKDVAEILEYSDTKKAIADNINEKYKKKLSDLIDISNRDSQIPLKGNEKASIYISEPGLYQLILKSKKEEAIQFQDKVFEEILPAIRKVGEEKYIKQLQEKQNELEEQKKLLQEVKKESNWIHEVGKNMVSLTKVEKRSGIVYSGWHKFEKPFYKVKIGYTEREARFRVNEHSSSTSYLNGFSMDQTYDCFYPKVCETFIHNILNPVMIRNQGNKTEHFMIHDKFANHIISKVINFENEMVHEVNKYVDLININNKNYEEVEKIIESKIKGNNGKEKMDDQNEDELEIEIPKNEPIQAVNSNEVKKCNLCNKFVSRDNFEYSYSSSSQSKAFCIDCTNERLLKCRKCYQDKKGKEFKMNGKVRSRICAECQDTPPDDTKVCRTCKDKKPKDEFPKYKTGKRKDVCKECEEDKK